MEHDQGSTVSLYLVFGVILVGVIALIDRIKEQRSKSTKRDNRSRDPKE